MMAKNLRVNISTAVIGSDISLMLRIAKWKKE